MEPQVEFWIQVGSFTSRGRADAIDQRLQEQGIASRITTRLADAELFYRVRVGPYLRDLAYNPTRGLLFTGSKCGVHQVDVDKALRR